MQRRSQKLQRGTESDINWCISITANFPLKALKSRKDLTCVLQKDHRFQVKLIHKSKFLHKIEGESKTFPDKSRLEEIVTIKPNLQWILEEIPHAKEIK